MPPRSVLEPKDGSRANSIGGISKLVGFIHVRTRKVKIQGNIEIIGRAERRRTL